MVKYLMTIEVEAEVYRPGLEDEVECSHPRECKHYWPETDDCYKCEHVRSLLNMGDNWVRINKDDYIVRFPDGHKGKYSPEEFHSIFKAKTIEEVI